MYSLVGDLVRANHMYQFSLETFLELFSAALGASPGAGGGESGSGSGSGGRIADLERTLTRIVVHSVSGALFKADRLTFGAHLAHGLRSDLFGVGEWELFLGHRVADVGSAAGRDLPTWAPAERKAAFAALATHAPQVTAAVGLTGSGASGAASAWQAWAAVPECEQSWETLGAATAGRLSAFQRVLVVQALRPDRLMSALHAFVCAALRVTEISPPPLDWTEFAAAPSAADRPALLIATPGSDPSIELADFAAGAVSPGDYTEIAMGQGQTEAALAALREAARAGTWLCLKNLHLAVSWVPVLEKELKALAPAEGFRLWLTTEAHDKFPVVLLRSARKVTFEAPPGVKKNLLRTYAAWSDDFVREAPSGISSPTRSQALFALAWLHAILQERRTYMPQGWCKFYEFSLSDLRVAAAVVDKALASGNGDWTTVRGLLKYAIYGGRIDNPYDFRVLDTYVDDLFGEARFGGGGRSGGREVRINGILVPASVDRRDYLALVEGLSEADVPATFGLSANIDRSVQRARSAALLATLGAMAVGRDEEAAFDREAWGAALSPLLSGWSQVLQSSDVLRLSNPLAAADGPPGSSGSDEAGAAIEAFLGLELDHGLGLVGDVADELASLERVLRGQSLMTPTLMNRATVLMRRGVPEDWYARWEGPLEPLAWLQGLVSKTVAVGALARGKQGGSSVGQRLLDNKGAGGEGIDLNDFFRPQAFLNALRQEAARAADVSMDGLRLVIAWEAGLLRAAPHPVTIAPLLLQGCVLDARAAALRPADGETPTLSPMPPATIAWVSAAGNASPYDRTVMLPVYETPARDKTVVTFEVPCDGPEAEWVLAGAAICLAAA